MLKSKNIRKKLIITALIIIVSMILYFSIFNKDILQTNLGSVQFFDRNGESLRTLLSADEKYSQKCNLSEISPHFLRAIILVEDRKFYSHHGVSISSVFRAIFQNIKENKVKSGASTISMQLAKLLKKNRKRTIFNKISETFFALKLELHLEKSRILEEYINRLPFGNLIYGIKSASLYYFKKKPKDLSLNQAIYLALIPKSPSFYNPINHIKRLKKRKNIILHEFKKSNFISKDEYTRLVNEGIKFNINKKDFIAPHFIELVLKKNQSNLKAKTITTIDKKIQLDIKGILSEYIIRLKPYNIKSAAAVVINKKNEVIAYVGSPDYFNKKSSGSVDYAYSLRQPGSTLKPFIYALALENGWTASSIIPDVRFPSRGGFFPSNHDGKEHGPLRLRPALANSFNIPAFYLAMKLTPKLIIDRLHKAGFSYLNKNSGFYGETIALGAGEVKLFDLVNAYTLFANKGFIKSPTLIIGNKPKSVKIFSEKIAYLIWNILSDPEARAISFGYYSSMSLPFPVAIKTGTSKGFRDKWAIGVNSEYSIGIWLGNPSGENMADLTGIASATSILRDIFLLVQKDWNKGNVTQPDGLQKTKICTLSGDIAGEFCKETKEEIYINIPGKECSYHQLRENKIITVFPELYKKWAIKNNLLQNIGISKNIKRQISFPQKRDFFYISDDIPIESQTIKFKVIGFDNGEIIEYLLNKKTLIKLPFPEFPSWQLKKGDYSLVIRNDSKIFDKVVFLVR